MSGDERAAIADFFAEERRSPPDGRIKGGALVTLEPGSATFPLPGIEAEAADDAERPVGRGGGRLTVTRPWPAMARGSYRDPERCQESYWSRFPARCSAGDGAKDAPSGQAVVAYLTVSSGVAADAAHGEARREHGAARIGPITRPETAIFTEDLPKTRSGKRPGRLLRDVAEGRDLDDTTTLAGPGVVEELRRRSAFQPGEG